MLTRHPLAAAAFIALVALASRLVFIIETWDVPGFWPLTPALDLDLHWRAADHILEGRAHSFELSSLSAPLFPYVLAGWKWAFGDSMLGFRLTMAVLGAIRLGALFLLARRWNVTPLASLIVCLGLAFLPSLIYFDTVPAKVGIELTLLVAVLWLASCRPARCAVRAAHGTLAGCLLALLLLTQLNTFLYAIPVLVFVLADRTSRWRQRVSFAAPVAIGAGVALAALLARPSAVAGSERFMPRAGVDLVIGWTTGAGPTYTPLPDVPATPFGHAFMARVALEARLGRPISAAEADHIHRATAVDQVVARPVDALALAARKVALFFNNEEVAEIHSLQRLRWHSRIARLPVGSGWLVTLAVVGVVGLWRRGGRRLVAFLAGLVAMQLVAVVLTIVTWRFRLPAVVPLAILAGHGIAYLGELVRQRRVGAWWQRVRRALQVVIPAALALGATMSPLLADKLASYRLAGRAGEMAAAESAKTSRRLAELERAGTPSIEAAIERALLLHRLHRYTDAHVALSALSGELHRKPEAAAAHLEYLFAAGDHRRACGFFSSLHLHAVELPERVTGAVNPAVAAALATFCAR